MDRLFEIIEAVWRILRGWHGSELRVLRKALIAFLIIPTILLLGAFFAGAFFGWWIKAVISVAEIYFVSLCFIWTARQRALIGIELGAIYSIYTPPFASDGNISSDRSIVIRAARLVGNGIIYYLRATGAILASEIVAGCIMFWLPVHNSFTYFLFSFLGLSMAMALVAYAFWTWGEFYWKKIAFATITTTLVISIFAILFPLTTYYIGTRYIGNSDEMLLKTIIKAERMDISSVSVPMPTPISQPEEFTLVPGEIIQTVEAGPRTHHRIQANKNFFAVAIQSDGGEKRYRMPSGTSYWNGAAPWGRLLLEGVEEGTQVEITRIN